MKIRNIILYVASAMGIVACGSADEMDSDLFASGELLKTDVATLSFTGTESKEINVTADCNWTISGGDSWLSISPMSGSSDCAVSVSPNETNPSAVSTRTSSFVIKSVSGEVSKTISVSQALANEKLTVNVTRLSCESAGAALHFAITSNGDWTIAGKEEWMTLSQESGSGDADITVTVATNTSETAREATLLVKGKSTTLQVVVSQSGKVTTLVISPTTISATALVGSYNISVTGDATWTATTDATWIAIDKKSGEGEATVKITCESNASSSSRTGTITIASSQKSLTCKVTQAAGEAPTVSSVTAQNVKKNSFDAEASFASDFDITECGFCLSSTSSKPTISGDKVSTTPTAKSGTFKLAISGLTSGKTYYVRAYATSAIGTGYGEVVTVTTGGSTPGSDDNPTPEM